MFNTNKVLFSWLLILGNLVYFDANAVSQSDYEAAVDDNTKVIVTGLKQGGDGADINARIYKPTGKGPFPALIALHGAGGIFPYQLWWAKDIANKGFIVLFLDHYCTRGHLCTHNSDDSDPERGEIMRSWQKVSPRQRVIDAAAGYKYLNSKPFVKKQKIGLIGWSWGGSSAIFAQKLSERLDLPNGGFKATIAFYPNLKFVLPQRQWKITGPIKQPLLILYGKDDNLESRESYRELMAEDHPGPINVIGYDGATRKFDELGSLRIKYHPSIGEFTKAFSSRSFQDATLKVNSFLKKYLGN